MSISDHRGENEKEKVTNELLTEKEDFPEQDECFFIKKL